MLFSKGKNRIFRNFLKITRKQMTTLNFGKNTNVIQKFKPAFIFPPEMCKGGIEFHCQDHNFAAFLSMFLRTFCVKF